MLYADKAALENRTKLRLLAIRERELSLYTQNCFTIGTVSALMAGLGYSSLVRMGRARRPLGARPTAALARARRSTPRWSTFSRRAPRSR